MLKKFRADLHIHTCLSPCADLSMTPSAIVKTSLRNGLDIIAITDHNSAENVTATVKAAGNKNLTVIAGMEITTSEEIHIIALFENIASIMELQNIVYKNMLSTENDDKQFGEQIVVNEKDEVLSFNRRLLIAATMLPTHSLLDIIHSLGGLSIASHIDKNAFSIVSQLGFIPEDMNFTALEISGKTERKKAEHEFRDYDSFALVTSSDAHNLEEIGRKTVNFVMEDPTVEEMTLALKNISRRKVEW